MSYTIIIKNPSGTELARLTDDDATSATTAGVPAGLVSLDEMTKTPGIAGSTNTGGCERLKFTSSAPLDCNAFDLVEVWLDAAQVWDGYMVVDTRNVDRDFSGREGYSYEAYGFIEQLKLCRWLGQAVFDITTSGTVSSGTSIPVNALDNTVPNGRTLTFGSVEVVVTTTAVAGDTSLEVDNISGSIPSSTTISTAYPVAFKDRFLEVLAVMDLPPNVSIDETKMAELGTGFALETDGSDLLFETIIERITTANDCLIGVDASGDIFVAEKSTTSIYDCPLAYSDMPQESLRNGIANCVRLETLEDDGAGNITRTIRYYRDTDSISELNGLEQWHFARFEAPSDQDAASSSLTISSYEWVDRSTGAAVSPTPSGLSDMFDADTGTYFEIPTSYMNDRSATEPSNPYDSQRFNMDIPSGPLRIDQVILQIEVLSSDMDYATEYRVLNSGGGSGNILFRVRATGGSLAKQATYYEADYAAGSHTITIDWTADPANASTVQLRNFVTKQIRIKEVTIYGAGGVEADAYALGIIRERSTPQRNWTAYKNPDELTVDNEYGYVTFNPQGEDALNLELQRIIYRSTRGDISTIFECGTPLPVDVEMGTRKTIRTLRHEIDQLARIREGIS